LSAALTVGRAVMSMRGAGVGYALSAIMTAHKIGR
jgi:hypothetical protein